MNQKQSPRDETPNVGAETNYDAKSDAGTDSANPIKNRQGGADHSLSRRHMAPQPTHPLNQDGLTDPNHPTRQLDDQEGDVAPQAAHDNDLDASFPAHVVLYQPEIPQNTGNIGRTCVAVGAKLWIVRPAGFRIDDARIRRAGLDYWPHLALGDAADWDDLMRQLAPRRLFFLSRFAKRTIWDAQFERGDVFVFGRESSGLPETICNPSDQRTLRLPTSPLVRSLNLATTVGVVLYEHQRQMHQPPAEGASVVS